MEGRIEIPGGDYNLEVPTLVKVVQDNGFTISSLKFKATGRVEKSEKGFEFIVQKTNVRYILNPNDSLEKLLEQSRKTSTPFSILGKVVIPPPKGEADPKLPLGSVTIENFTPVRKK
ncbi:hypothetical protein JYT44_01970 [Caldithrix abyssi]|nr:hypothetical protein [Caldithrix abyssi]